MSTQFVPLVDTIVYFNDVEDPAVWRLTVEALRQAQVDAVDFYYIREHELRHPELEEVRQRLTIHAQRAVELRALGMHCGVGLVPTLGWGQALEDGPFEKIVGPDGARSGMGSCPLDPSLVRYLEELVTAIVRAGFDSINLEDDFQNDNHRPVKQGCFCPRHLARFSELTGRAWSRVALVDALARDAALSRQWGACKRGVLVDLLARLQQRAATVRPGVRWSLLTGADVNFDPVPLLATGLLERWRPAQAGYGDERTVPLECAWRGALSHEWYGRARGLKALAEITSWPRNSFTKSWATVTLQAAANAFLGLDVLLLWLGHGLRDPGFGAAIGTRRPWFDALARLGQTHPQPRGLATPVKPTGFTWDRALLALARLGLPIALLTEPGRAHAQDPLLLPAIDAYLPQSVATLAGRPLVLDAAGIAAHGAALGLGLSPAPAFFSCEQLGDHEGLAGYRRQYSSCLTLTKPQDMHCVTGVAAAQAWGHYLDNRSQPVTPSVLLDQARRLLLLNHAPDVWPLLLGFGKAAQLRAALAALLGRPLCAAVSGVADVALQVRDGDHSRAVLALNLSYDPAHAWRLELDFTPTRCEVLDEQGTWRPVPNEQSPLHAAGGALPARQAQAWKFFR